MLRCDQVTHSNGKSELVVGEGLLRTKPATNFHFKMFLIYLFILEKRKVEHI